MRQTDALKVQRWKETLQMLLSRLADAAAADGDGALPLSDPAIDIREMHNAFVAVALRSLQAKLLARVCQDVVDQQELLDHLAIALILYELLLPVYTEDLETSWRPDRMP